MLMSSVLSRTGAGQIDKPGRNFSFYAAGGFDCLRMDPIN